MFSSASSGCFIDRLVGCSKDSAEWRDMGREGLVSMNRQKAEGRKRFIACGCLKQLGAFITLVRGHNVKRCYVKQ